MKSIVYIAYACFLAAAMSGCGGGGGGNSSSQTADGVTVISGIVSDDPISGATVNAVSTDTGIPLGDPVVTGTDGSYTLTAKTNAIGSGYKLTSTGGTMLGQPFEGSMSAIYPAGTGVGKSNVTLITSSLVAAANSTTQYTGTILQKWNAIVNAGRSSGTLGADYSAVDTVANEAARNSVKAIGLESTIALFAQRYSAGSVSNPCIGVQLDCAYQDVGFNAALSIAFGDGTTVTALTGKLSGCRVIALYNTTSQTLSVTAQGIASNLNAGSTPSDYSSCVPAGDVTLKLGNPNYSPQSNCAKNPAAMMGFCVTARSGVESSYEVSDGKYHRIYTNTYTTNSLKGNATPVTLTRNYASSLTTSKDPDQDWTDKTAVIFVHGFTPTGFGGDDGTWGALPKLVLEDPSIVALNFQWKTDSDYLAIAPDLAKAVEFAFNKINGPTTNKKVHIIAHSFGGVLSRVMLQDLSYSSTTISATKVKTLTTVGTPHSGIVNESQKQFVKPDVDVPTTLPKGWGANVPGDLCPQLTCYQSGLNVLTLADWLQTLLAGAPSAGYINARLADTANHPLPSGLKVRVLIGQIIEGFLGVPIRFSTDDGLIAYAGQRFYPTLDQADLLNKEFANGGAEITERILGLESPAGANALPGKLVGTIKFSDYTYQRSPLTTALCDLRLIWRYGYKHSTFTATAVTGGADACVENSEVNIPESCGTAATCKHDTWINVREMLCEAPRTIVNEQCVGPTVTSITPSTATAGVPITLAVVGQNLPLAAVLSMADAVCQTPTNRTTTGFNVTCTPGSTSGVKPVVVNTDTLANAGLLISEISFTVLNASANAPQAMANFPTICKGQSTVMAGWTKFGTAVYNQATNTYSVGDPTAYDPNDGDSDCNPVDSWQVNGPTGSDNDFLVYNLSTTGDIDFSADACISYSPLSGHLIGLWSVDPAFTGLPRSGHNPVINHMLRFSTQWNLPGQLHFSVGVGAAPIRVANAVASSKGFCGNYRMTRVGNLYSAYFNSVLLGSAVGSTEAIVPFVMAYDGVVTMTPTVVFPN